MSELHYLFLVFLDHQMDFRFYNILIPTIQILTDCVYTKLSVLNLSSILIISLSFDKFKFLSAYIIKRYVNTLYFCFIISFSCCNRRLFVINALFDLIFVGIVMKN